MAKEEKKELFSSGHVATSTREVILDPAGQPLSVEQALAQLLNDLDDLKRGLLR